ncbi:hypothetical protein EJ06DRAFT_532057 [Trichodelitschia bisporula]|uniref:Uncharacterized protein n=1 Tax=Trichodelitschia bisporula TaxID=703511 RepID=A0A6G1HQH5_9PEZI|nr:hypothetical protein EJ06DRAFT_532057 [Trichodelitschia bisporula]
MSDLQSVTAHLRAVRDSPSTPLDAQQLEAARLILAPTLTPEDTQGLILEIYQLLPTLQQDPAPATHLLDKLLEPVPLTTILSMEPPVDLIKGLDLAAMPFNDITLRLLDKADTASGRQLAATMPELFVALVRLWLYAEAVSTGDLAGRVLLRLLKVDKMDADKTGWDGRPIWKRIFRDKDVYVQIFAACDLTKGDRTLSKNRKTIAQARLLSWLPEVGGMDWTSISQSYHPEIEKHFGLQEGRQSLVDYAALSMVDTSDVLMHRSLISFYSRLLLWVTATSGRRTVALSFLSDRGLHQRTINYYAEPGHITHDPLDASLLYPDAAGYVVSWVSTNSLDFTGESSTYDPIVSRLNEAFNRPPSAWLHDDDPVDDMQVLTALPRTFLVALGSRSPLNHIPVKVSSANALAVLAEILRGPLESTDLIFPTPSDAVIADRTAEIDAARTLYRTYTAEHPRFWNDVIGHAETVALTDLAIAANNLIKAIVSAPWDGVAAITESGGASAHLVPYLLGPPRRFANLVGGRGDAESAAYKVAVARFEAVKAFLKAVKGKPEYKMLEEAAARRVAEGAWGAGDAPPGGLVATMEM